MGRFCLLAAAAFLSNYGTANANPMAVFADGCPNGIAATTLQPIQLIIQTPVLVVAFVPQNTDFAIDDKDTIHVTNSPTSISTVLTKTSTQMITQPPSPDGSSNKSGAGGSPAGGNNGADPAGGNPPGGNAPGGSPPGSILQDGNQAGGNSANGNSPGDNSPGGNPPGGNNDPGNPTGMAPGAQPTGPDGKPLNSPSGLQTTGPIPIAILPPISSPVGPIGYQTPPGYPTFPGYSTPSGYPTPPTGPDGKPLPSPGLQTTGPVPVGLLPPISSPVDPIGYSTPSGYRTPPTGPGGDSPSSPSGLQGTGPIPIGPFPPFSSPLGPIGYPTPPGYPKPPIYPTSPDYSTPAFYPTAPGYSTPSSYPTPPGYPGGSSSNTQPPTSYGDTAPTAGYPNPTTPKAGYPNPTRPIPAPSQTCNPSQTSGNLQTCPTALPDNCAQLANTNSLALLLEIPLCVLELGVFDVGNVADCLVTDLIGENTQGEGIVQCLIGALEGQCIQSLPDTCLALSGLEGGLTPQIGDCVSSLGPLGSNSVLGCTAELFTGDDILDCLLRTLGLEAPGDSGGDGLNPVGDFCSPNPGSGSQDPGDSQGAPE